MTISIMWYMRCLYCGDISCRKVVFQKGWEDDDMSGGICYRSLVGAAVKVNGVNVNFLQQESRGKFAVNLSI